MKLELCVKALALLIAVIVGNSRLVAQGVGEKAPDFTLNSSAGGEFTLSNQQGKVVFINFIGYTCGICINNASLINTEVYDKFKNNDNFVAIAIDAWDGNEDGVNYYIENSGVSFPVLSMGSEVAAAYNSGKHRIVVIDGEGTVQHNTNNDADAEEIADAVIVLDELLSETTSTGIDLNLMLIYPNPAQGKVHVKLSENNENASLKLLNAVGKELISMKIRSSASVDLSAFPRGIYFVQLSKENSLITRKLVLE